MVLSRFLNTQRILLVVTLILLATITAWAVGGSISGTIKDSTGGVIPGAKITVTNTALHAEFTTMTDAKGYFSFLKAS